MLIFERRHTTIFAAAIIIAINDALSQTFTVLRKARIEIIIIFIVLKIEIGKNKLFTLIIPHSCAVFQLTLQKHIGLSQLAHPSIQSV